MQPRNQSRKSALEMLVFMRSQETLKWKVNITGVWHFKTVRKSKSTKPKVQPVVLKPPIQKLGIVA